MIDTSAPRTHCALSTQQSTPRTYGDENVIPMINVVFLLLLYFMVLGNLQPDTDFFAPMASSVHADQPDAMVVLIAEDGTISVGDREVTVEELAALIQRSAAIKTAVRLHADARVDAVIVANIVQIASRAGTAGLVLTTRKPTGYR